MSQDVFQLQMDAILEQCPGVIGIHDYMVIFGVDQQDHDTKPHQPLKRMPEGGIGTEQQEVGTSKRASDILRGRVQCTRHASRPQEGQGDQRNEQCPRTSNQLQSFLGMVNYMGTFIPNLSHHTEPLWAMLKKDNVFHWEDQQTQSFSASQDLNCESQHHTT